MDVDDRRHFENNFQDYSPNAAAEIFNSDFKLSSNFKDLIIKAIISQHNELCHYTDLKSKNYSIYTGLSGVSLYLLNLSNSSVPELNDIISKSRRLNYDIIKRSLELCSNEPSSFLCGDTGPLTLSVMAEVAPQNHNLIIEMSDFVIHDKKIPDELLYGRSGYLYALLKLRKFGKHVSSKIIKNVFKSIINSGHKLSRFYEEERQTVPPLYYEWHKKGYLGAAHGMSGIMYMLLEVYMDDSLSDIREDIQNDVMDSIKKTIEHLTELRLPSGNYPSSFGESSHKDVLVHWCHGATGWVFMFIAAHKVYKDDLYLERIKEIGDVVWKRGLLEKGCGICHGSAGSGYALMAIFNYTKDPKYLYRALKFGEWCTDYEKNRTRIADRPYSMFEGLAGTTNYLVDCLDATKAKFPGFEL